MPHPKPRAVARRSPSAVAAFLQGGAGPMAHRCAPRGGARNLRGEWLEEVEEVEESPEQESEVRSPYA